MKTSDATPTAPVADSGDKLSRLRQQLREQLQSLNDLAWVLGDSGPLIMGSYYMVYKTCTQPNCKCRRGEKHGPFPALSWSVQGKRRMVMVKQADAAAVQRKALAFRNYRKGMVKVRQAMDGIERILEQVRALLTEEYTRDELETDSVRGEPDQGS